MITASELAQIQADAAALLDLPCVIQRPSRTPRASGGASVVYNTISPNGLLCGMAEPTGGQLANFDYLVGSLAAWHVKLPVGTNVQEKDRVIISGETLDVVKVLAPRSYQVLVSVLATEVK